jgi:hypothetical protein
MTSHALTQILSADLWQRALKARITMINLHVAVPHSRFTGWETVMLRVVLNPE